MNDTFLLLSPLYLPGQYPSLHRQPTLNAAAVLRHAISERRNVPPVRLWCCDRLGALPHVATQLSCRNTAVGQLPFCARSVLIAVLACKATLFYHLQRSGTACFTRRA